MPKKYHRPPTVKRRKQRKTSIPYVPEQPPAGDGSPVAVAEEPPEAAAGPETPAPVREEPVSHPAAGRATVKHITRDHRYVKAEVVRIVVIAGFLIASILITAILRG